MRGNRTCRAWRCVLSFCALPVCLPGISAGAGDVSNAPACAACHSTPHATAAVRPGCMAGCHSPGGMTPADIEAEAKAADAAPPVPVAPDDAGRLPGMGVPLYYEQSRVGTHPNEMIHIPAGPFTMGTDERLPDEGPAHTVTLPAYDIDRYEVTNGQYKAFMDATGHRSPSQFENRTWPPGKVDHPVVGVTWNDAHDYCAWAGKRLPTDEEWEKAARGTDARRYPWGEEFGMQRANTPLYWTSLGREGDTSPVGAFADGASPYGLYDMTGNVWEWTESWYRAYPGNTHPNENYGEHYKTLKGGSWWDCSFYKCGISAPSFNRSFFLKTTRNNSFGFRCAKDAH